MLFEIFYSGWLT